MSNSFNPDGSKFGILKDKVVVLTGGANGIGASVVKVLHSNGSKVIFGDYDGKAGESLAGTLGSDLFKLAREKYGHIDHAVAIAGVGEKGRWFKVDLTIEDVEKPEQNGTVDVNLLGVLYFLRVALPYMRLDRDGEDKSLVVVGSSAGFRDTPDLPVYNATKHGVQGILRALRRTLWDNGKIRINVVNPGVTDTNMANTLADTFRAAGLGVNTPQDVAVTILGFLTETNMWGKSVYVEGGRGYEWESGYWNTMSTWLGEEPTQTLQKSMELVASTKVWDQHHIQEATR